MAIARLIFPQIPKYTMEDRGSQLPTDKLVERILSSGQLSRIDRQQLKFALLDDSINEKELVLIERVIDGVRKGLLDIVDEN
ncbi:hypothetical protein [Kamptonema sp. UHCC 0994]|uniref:hypothetical protein n=1 Tax=Kamptonema sp. UHCC 0994 TaxID=3031329 RepID=UPI0023BA1153|nr:hypothetical protein [Kamptonema sp. UHCC 0994]MDF0553245.1 hypothetical protein [Kamptonema sp. UHCC 0994]